MNETPYVEVGLFKLKAGVSEDDFVKASDANLADLQSIDGFLQRQLSKSEDGQWLDLIYYESPEAAKKAEGALMEAESFAISMAMMDEDASTWLRVVPERSYGRH